MNEQVIQRVPVGKRLRFEIFNRDRFTCQYCGKQSPNVILHIDHVVPVARGGTNEFHNLLTACFDCNSGKSTSTIDATQFETMPSSERMEEHRIQVEEFLEYTKKMKALEDQLVLQIWQEFGYSSEADSRITMGFKSFVKEIGFSETLHAAQIAASRFEGGLRERYKYFCGVCRNKKMGGT